MEVYDFIMLGVVAIGTLFGAWKGLAWQVASLASVFASYFIAYQFRGPLGKVINASPPWNTLLAMLILFLGCSLAIWLVFRFVSDVIERVKLKEFDRHAGAALGFCRGIVWCVIITLFAVALLGEAQKKAIIESRSGYYIALLLDRSHAIMPDEVHDVIGRYVHSLDGRLADEERTSHRHEDDTTSLSDTEHPDHNADPLAPANISDDASGSNEADEAIERWLQRVPEIRFNSQDQ
jgi:membrane protein required for colicin V production